MWPYSIVLILAVLAFFFPLDAFRRRRIWGIPRERFDERDVMFARIARQPGTPEYEDYYTRRPVLKDLDDKLRAMPPLLNPGGLYYDERIIADANQWFNNIEKLSVDVSEAATWATYIDEARDKTNAVKHLVRSLGAVAVGVTALEQGFVYTFKGRFDEEYGNPISLDHPNIIVFLVEMDYDAMHQAPRCEVLRESAKQYYRAAKISKIVETILQRAGYKAKAHFDAHYDLILPPLAVAAGLGELGRNNILVADRFGSRVRIGAVTTDIEMKFDVRAYLGVKDFCEICKKCAENCPSGALKTGEPSDIRGVEKWPTRVGQCYRFWRTAGTDCGVCMAVCPFSHRNNWFHNTIRQCIRLNPWIRRIALKGDDLIYGRKWKISGINPNQLSKQ